MNDETSPSVVGCPRMRFVDDPTEPSAQTDSAIGTRRSLASAGPRPSGSRKSVRLPRNMPRLYERKAVEPSARELLYPSDMSAVDTC